MFTNSRYPLNEGSWVLITIVIRFNFQLYCTKKLVLYVSRNQRAIVREGPDNPGAGLVGACTFQDKHIGQQDA